MSKNQIFACSFILKEHLGEVVEKVGTLLMKKGPMPSRMISQETSLSLNQVKKALCTMIQQNLVFFEQHKRGYIEYCVDYNHVLNRARFHRYIYSAKLIYGESGELLVEELLQHGQCQMLNIIERVTSRLNEAYNGEQTASKSDIYKTFTNLVNTNFMQRCPRIRTDTDAGPAPQFEFDEDLLYRVPTMETEEANRKRKREADQDAGPASKRLRSDSGSAIDSGSFEVKNEIGNWKPNYERFHQYMRDQVIISAILKKFDKKAANIVSTILRISERKSDPSAPVTNPVSSHEIMNELSKDCGIDRQLLDQYLTVLAEDSCEFVLKAGDSGGGMYSIHIQKALISLAKAHIESVIQERFGSKCLRIVKLLLLKKHLEQKEIEQFAMVPAKEAKEMLYNMFGQNFVTITEIPKTPDHAPSRTFYLFSVDLNSVARMLLDTAYKSVGNVISRRLHETKENKRLLDKQQRVEAIAASLEQNGADPSQREEVEEMITPPEKAQLAKIKHMTNKLEQSEIQLDETIFALQMYLRYAGIKVG